MNIKMNTKQKLVYMKQPDIKILKEKIWSQNDKKCPILKKEISLDKMVLDHKHKLKSEIPGPNRGTIRTALDMRANALAGKIENNFKRYFGSDEKNQPLSLPDFLRNMADYLEAGDYIENVDSEEIFYIHPNEVPKRKKVQKREYNKIKKYYSVLYPRRKKVPKFTYMTPEVEKILDTIQNRLPELELELKKKRKRKE